MEQGAGSEGAKKLGACPTMDSGRHSREGGNPERRWARFFISSSLLSCVSPFQCSCVRTKAPLNARSSHLSTSSGWHWSWPQSEKIRVPWWTHP